VPTTDPAIIRNFCIIAHIDHGKSTLADRMLQLTGVVDARQMRAQYLDKMDIERERGITIKAQNVRLPWQADDGRDYVLHMIDTPGHVDFTYEVSRSLAAVRGHAAARRRRAGHRGADAGQPLPRARERPAHHPGAEQDRPARGAARQVRRGDQQDHRLRPGDVLRISAKTGEGVPDVLNAICRDVPAPVGSVDSPARAMIFDSVYDSYRGVITYVRVFDGQLSTKDRG
jgi:GTP-binding protein LepA